MRSVVWSGKRDSNSPPTAWKAVALPDELLPLIFSVQIYEKLFTKRLKQQKKWGEEDSNLRRLRQQIYSLPHLTALESPQNKP